MENLTFKYSYKIPTLNEIDMKIYSDQARLSVRRRSPYIIHKKGDEFNQVFNFILEDSYMTPHLHPEPKMVEKMHLISGSFKLLIFNDNGKVRATYNLDKPGQRVQVPSSTWHTYIMTSKLTIIYETMIGVYDPKTWKKMSEWAPKENTQEAKEYLQVLKNT